MLTSNKSSRFAASFQGISQLGSAFITSLMIQTYNICVQVIRLHKSWCSQNYQQLFWTENWFHI